MSSGGPRTEKKFREGFWRWGGSPRVLSEWLG